MTDKYLQAIIDLGGGNFKASEFGEGREKLNTRFVRDLSLWRAWTNIMTQITNAWRPTGSHMLGKSADVLLWREWRKTQPDPMHMWRLATTWGWQGVGIYFDWNDGIGLHVDSITTEEAQRTGRTRPLRWIRAEGVYYYQSLTTGHFYSQSGKQTTLEKQIKIHSWR